MSTPARHVYRTYVRGTAEEVWRAITDTDLTSSWFHGAKVEAVSEVHEPPTRLVQTWRVLHDAAMAEEPPSRVEWTITDAGDGMVRVDLVHGDLARSPRTWAFVRDGWVWIIESTKSLVETGSALPEATRHEPEVVDDAAAEWHRAEGITTNNAMWGLVGEPGSPERDEELLRLAYASAYHWQRAARRGPENEVRARYMLAKVLLLVGQPERSLHYADACLAGCVEHGLVDFDLAYAHEARARVLGGLGRADESLAAWALARAVEIVDPEDREIVESDFADAP